MKQRWRAVVGDAPKQNFFTTCYIYFKDDIGFANGQPTVAMPSR
jgi:hypothetical protein